ncbi:uroporphyrinogen-III C-methyltransferase [Thermohalobacter berrensis]|uniref:uroporphyrinogen-III C-methyltransferase n=1 Tax=Thermohalobacter berrensis TaxID=99594 RepID=A0A419SZK1_9FIRM|nr:uroporphyrinogen-III C-methyltransferase [Thermohalobacter berrensis]RKD30623.1 uroporphyrinogen-III C-methyltransferase [Thermohalobacter berrensis]
MKGKVYLVGAGPGDFELITLKGLKVLQKADVVVYDRLVNKKLLKELEKDCELIYVGKKANKHTMKQENINKLLADKAIEGKIVVRLKGGDPYVFGRGGEEGEFLYKKGIDFEVIPGITSAIGGLAYSGIPITHRDYASSFHVITGHLKDDSKELNWKAISNLQGTLVFLMGMSNLKKITKKLIENGKDKCTSVAVINWAANPNQKVVIGNLENIYEKVQKENIKPPALIVVGEVVKLREKLNFYEKKPLFGKNIVVTRARAQSSSLIKKINELGGNPIEFPTIKIKEIVPNNEFVEAINELRKYNYIIFTSVNGVKIFFNKLFDLGFDTRSLGHCKIVAIGPATAKSLIKWGVKADIIPEKYVGEEIYKELAKVIRTGDSVLIPRSKDARSYLVDSLKKICHVKEIKTYKTVLGNGDKKELLELLDLGKIDYITFTSSSTVKNFIDIIGKDNIVKIKDVKFISIGPITSKTIKDYGLKVYKQAKEYTIDGIIDCILKD